MSIKMESRSKAEHFLSCEDCIAYLRSRGEAEGLYVSSEPVEREEDWNEDDEWVITDNLKCWWCEENDVDLYDCHWT